MGEAKKPKNLITCLPGTLPPILPTDLIFFYHAECASDALVRRVIMYESQMQNRGDYMLVNTVELEGKEAVAALSINDVLLWQWFLYLFPIFWRTEMSFSPPLCSQRMRAISNGWTGSDRLRKHPSSLIGVVDYHLRNLNFIEYLQQIIRTCCSGGS